MILELALLKQPLSRRNQPLENSIFLSNQILFFIPAQEQALWNLLITNLSNNGPLGNLVSTTDGEDPLTLNAQLGNANQLVVIDVGIENYDQLVQNVSTDAAVLVLDPQIDGISQIDNAIKQFQNLIGLHILSHGSSGQLQLGNTQFNSDSLEFYEDTLKSWDDVLTDTLIS